MFKDEEEVCEVTPHSEPQQKKAGGNIKHNTKAVKKLAATQAFPGDNVDEGSSPEPPAKKAKQPAKPAAGVQARGRIGAGAPGQVTFDDKTLEIRFSAAAKARAPATLDKATPDKPTPAESADRRMQREHAAASRTAAAKAASADKGKAKVTK
eukprot:jgi/Tetstr1/443717/TSEL_031707.t1